MNTFFHLWHVNIERQTTDMLHIATWMRVLTDYKQPDQMLDDACSYHMLKNATSSGAWSSTSRHARRWA